MSEAHLGALLPLLFEYATRFGVKGVRQLELLGRELNVRTVRTFRRVKAFPELIDTTYAS